MRVATHGQVVVGDAVAGGLTADAQEDRPAGGAVVIEELEVALLELPVVLKSRGRRERRRSAPQTRILPQYGCAVRDREPERELTHSGGEVVEALVHPPLVLRKVPAAGGCGGGDPLGCAREEEGEEEGDDASARPHHRSPPLRLKILSRHVPAQ